MKIKPHNLKSFFNLVRKSPIDDMAINAVKYNADDLALGALDIVDDIPKSISLDDIAVDSWRKKQGLDDFSKPPITPSEFVNDYKSKWHDNFETRELLNTFPEQYANAPTELELALHPDDGMSIPMSNDEIYDTLSYNFHDWHPAFGDVPAEDFDDFYRELYDAGYKFDSTPDYDAMNVVPERFGQSPYTVDHILYPDGFEDPEDFARYHDALERGYATKETPPYLYPTHSRIPWRSPMRNRREISAGQHALDPYTVSGDVPANSSKLSELYKRITGTY